MQTTYPQPTTESEFQPTAEPFTSTNAPRTFDPFNTRRCPELFRDRWRETTDGAGGH